MHILFFSVFFHALVQATGSQAVIAPASQLSNADIQATREFWMRRAIAVLEEQTGSPCPFAAFGTVIVNHTADACSAVGSEQGCPSPAGTLVCAAVNAIGTTGDPTLHGEVAALRACVSDLQRPPHNLSPGAARRALRGLSLYTTAEPCPMCASAARWAGLREVVFGTSMPRLVALGWAQIDIRAAEVFARSQGLGAETTLVSGVLDEETDAYFAWQFGEGGARKPSCPRGCQATRRGDEGWGCQLA
ncbi:hypothetical protein RB595_001881 [Gaeumannomyces hyphopodioides]